MKKINAFVFLFALLNLISSVAWSNPDEILPNILVNSERLNLLNQRANEMMPFDYEMFSAENEFEASVKMAEQIGNMLKDPSFQIELVNLASDVQSFFATGNVLEGTPQNESNALTKEQAMNIHPLILLLGRSAILVSYEHLASELVQYTGNTKLVAGLIGLATMGFGGLYYDRRKRSKHSEQVYLLEAAHNCAKAKISNKPISGCDGPALTKMIMVYQTIFSANILLSQIRTVRAETNTRTFAAAQLKISGQSRIDIQFVGRQFLGDLWEVLIHSGDFNAIGVLRSLMGQMTELADTIPNSGREIRKGVGRDFSTSFYGARN